MRPFNLQKNSTVPYESWKKISSKLDAQSIKEAEYYADFENV